MDCNNWRAAQGQVQIPGQVNVGEAGNAAGMEGVDWRTQLHPDSRQRIVNKIMETLKRHLPFSGPEGLQELKKIAVRFEEKIYAAATSQSDYLRKISLKMLTMETRSQNPMANSLQSSAASTCKNSQETASQNMQSQIQNQVQQQPVPMISNQSQVRQQLISQNIQSNIASTGVPNSAGLASALPPIGGMPQSTISTVPGQNPNIQNIQSMSNLTSNAMGNPMGQGVPSNAYVNSQRQIQGRQPQGATQEQQQQNSQQYLYNQQIQQQLMKQKLQQGVVPQQSIMQTQVQQQQQNLLQPNQLQSSQQAAMQSSLRQTSSSSTLQNQQSSLQQSTQSIMQQQSQSILRQQQQQQQPHSSVMHQQQNSMPQHPILSSQQQQQQQLSGQQANAINMQQNQLIGQQSSILDAQSQHQQQQRMIIQQNNISNIQQQQAVSLQNNLQSLHSQQLSGQQNNLPNVHQQQLGPQANLSGFQQQQMVGIQHGNSSLQANQQPVHMLQQSKVSAQHQMQQNMTNMLPNQSQQPQSQPMQQQLMSQMQPQSSQLHQQLGLQQQTNVLSRDMQQRVQNSGPIQQQTTIDQQKQIPQPQRAISEVQIDCSSPIGNVGCGDWQEEIYQKIKSMYEMYYHELNEMCQRMAIKLQQHDAIPQPQKNDQLEKFNFFKVMLERLLAFLRTNKKDIQISHKEKIVGAEKQIVNILNSHRPRKPVASLQKGQLAQPHMLSVQPPQQQTQISHMHTNEGQMNSQMQTLNVQGSVLTPQQNNLSNLQNNLLSSVSSVPNARQNMIDVLKPGSNVDPGQSNGLNQMQQVAMNSLQQNPVSGPQQMNPNLMSSQTGLTTLASGVNPLQTNSHMFQTQQIKQEQQMFSTQQLKQQYQQRQIQQQFMQRQQMIQQQQQLQTAQQQQQLQTTQQQPSQLPVQQMTQLNQMTDANDVKMRHQMGGKPGIVQSHSSSGQRSSYHHQQMKSGTQFSISSQQVLQVGSPQIVHQSSPQLDQQNLLSSLTKVGTPLQSANSPFIVPSPSTSMAPSPVPGDTEKITSGVSSLSNVGNTVNHPPSAASNIPNQSLAIGTPGISASPLLAEFTSPDGTQGAASNIVFGNSNVVEQPLDRLIKAVKSLSPRSLSASVSDISSVVSLVDRIAGSAPGNGSRAAVGEDLVAMTKCHLQAGNFFGQDGPSSAKKMRRYTSAMTSNVVSSTGSINDSLRHLSGNESDVDSTGASCIKQPRTGYRKFQAVDSRRMLMITSKANHELQEELREINQRLIDTVVHISDDVDPTAVAAASGVGEGTVVKCSFSAVALSPNLKSQYASAQMSPIQPLRLLIPKDYPNCSPVLLDKFPIEVSNEYEDLSIKAKSRFSISLRTLSHPMSLGDIARTWDKCARAVITEYVQVCGGGTFSSKYGTWEKCLSAA